MSKPYDFKKVYDAVNKFEIFNLIDNEEQKKLDVAKITTKDVDDLIS